MRQPVCCLVDLAVGVLAALIDDGDRIRSPRGLLGHQVGRVLGAVSNVSPRDTSRSHSASASSISASADSAVSGSARALSSSTAKCSSIWRTRAGSRISSRCSASTSAPVAVEFDHEAQWQLGEVAAQLVALALDAGRAESAAIGLAESEADPGHPLGAVPAIGVQFAHRAVQVDPLVRECPGSDVARRCQQLAEAHRRLRPQPHHHRVAEIADGVVGSGAAIEHRGGHEEVVAVGIAMHQGAERGHQHHVRGAAGFARQRHHPLGGCRRIAAACCGGAPVGRHTRTRWAGKLQRLRQIRHDGPPVVQIGLGGVRSGRGRQVAFRPQVAAPVGPCEISEEHPPRAVVPGDVVGDEQQRMFVGGHAHSRDPQRCIGGQVEGRGEFALSQHLQAKPPCAFGQAGQVVFCPPRAQIVVHRRPGVAFVADSVGRAQYPMAARDVVDCIVQPRDIDLAGDPIGDTDVEQRATGVDRLHEPHPGLAVGELVVGAGAGSSVQPKDRVRRACDEAAPVEPHRAGRRCRRYQSREMSTFFARCRSLVGALEFFDKFFAGDFAHQRRQGHRSADHPLKAFAQVQCQH